tara:strand:- start:1435 stop:1686 length:252 start_codon:yes stop_codon:yes gene_type:complete
MKVKKDRVVFRKFNNGQVIALLQDNLANFGMIDSYMHIGQHSEASINIINDTKLANKSEYKTLLSELEMIGYNLRVMKKVSYK